MTVCIDIGVEHFLERPDLELVTLHAVQEQQAHLSLLSAVFCDCNETVRAHFGVEIWKIQTLIPTWSIQVGMAGPSIYPHFWQGSI